MSARRFAGARRGRHVVAAASLAVLPADVLAIVDVTVDSQRGSAFRADSYVLNAGKVSDLVDLVDRTHTMHQADSAKQAGAPAVSSVLTGKPTLTLTAAQVYASTRAASAWRYTHNGLGSTQYYVFVASPSGATSRILSSTYKFGNHATEKGAVILHTATAAIHNVANATATRSIARTVATTVTTGVAYIYRVDFFELPASQDDHFAIDGTQVGAGTSSAAASILDPTSAMCLFANPDGTNGFAGEWAESIFIPKLLSGGEQATMSSYFTSRYGKAG